jgi:hypothetical protein
MGRADRWLGGKERDADCAQAGDVGNPAIHLVMTAINFPSGLKLA